MTNAPRSVDDVAARRTARILRFLVVIPFAITAGLAVWQRGHATRALRADVLVFVADSIARQLGVGLAAADAARDTTVVRAILRDLENAGHPASLHLRDSDWRAASPTTIARDAALPAALVDRLEFVDGPYAAVLDRRITALAPVRDADQWEIIGALAVRANAPDPARLPFSALVAAAVAFTVLLLAARGWRRAMAYPAVAVAAASRNVGARTGSVLRSGLLVAVTPVAFTLWLIATRPPDASGLVPLALLAAWALPAWIGKGLARLAAKPLALREAAHAWAFLAPSLLHLLIFSVGPILFSLWLSFHEWNLLDPVRPFVGLDNYRELAADGAFRQALRNTAVYVLFVPAGMAVALAVALLVNQRIPGVRVLRSVLFLPYITSFVAISLVWRWMFQPDVGLFNNVLGRIGIPPQPWLSSPVTALPSLMIMSIWMYTGYMMIIFLAGLQNVPETLYESARIDGAGPWRRLFSITLPMLRPTMFFILVTMIIFMFQVFTAVYVMTEGGPLHATDVVVYHIYRAAWEYLRMGYASAMAWVLFAVVFLITLVQFRWLGGRQPT